MADLKYDLERLADDVDRGHGNVPVGAIIDRGQRRRRRRSATAGAGVMAAVALVAGVVVTLPADGPGVEVLGQPGQETGEWSVVADGLPGGTNDADSWVASDGRIVLAGGTRGMDGAPELGGVVVDPATGESQTIPDPGLDVSPLRFPAFAGDRLLVFGGLDGSPHGAYYDLTTETWTAVPDAPTGDVAPSVLAWDGTTLVVGDTNRITAVENTGQYGNLQLWRWTVGDSTWTELGPTPVDPGRLETAVNNGKLAVWTNDTEPAPETGLEMGPLLERGAEQRDSRLAVLDVATDVWTVAHRDTLPDVGEGNEATIGWLGDRVVLAPLPPFGEGTVSGPDVPFTPADLPAPNAWDPDSDTWEQLAELPSDLQEVRVRYRQTGGVGPDAGQPLQATIRDVSVAAMLADGTWTTPVDADQIVRVGADLVALAGTTRQQTPLRAAYWDNGTWRSATDQDVGTRRYSTVAADDTNVYVTGGWTLRLGTVPDSVRETLRLELPG